MPDTRPKNWIRVFRAFSHLSQEQVAAAAGICQATLSKWERDAASPSPEQRARLAEVLAVPIDMIFPKDDGPED